MDLVLVVTQLRSRLWAHLSVVVALQGRVVRWQHARRGADHRANGLISLLVFGPAHDLLQRRAVFGGGLPFRGWDARVLGQIVMVVGRGFGHRADKAVFVKIN